MENFLNFLLLLIASGLLTGVTTALHRLGRSYVEEFFVENPSFRLLNRYFRFFFKDRVWEGLFFSLSFTKQVLQLCYALAFFFFLLLREPFSNALLLERKWDLIWVFVMTAIIIAAALMTNFVLNLISLANPKKFLKFTAPLATFLLMLFSIITAPLFKIIGLFLPKAPTLKKLVPGIDMREKILQVLEDSDLAPYFDESDQKLLSSVVSFKEKMAREVMVPRIDLFSLPAETTLQEATKSFLEQGYSRIPVFRESIDNVVGVILFKDVLNHHAAAMLSEGRSSLLAATIEGFIKPVLYTPETKKIPQLLQEFRSKQIHLAIVVDEWGGTEGIITIEDILEELVGEIADEYDIGEEALYSHLPGGGWIVDGKMGLIDIAEELSIKIPESPEYETIGGYIVHRAGTIPSKGWRIHHEEFDLEVLSSDERSVDKIRITPLKPE